MKTSIHILPVKTGSEVHNLREKELDYVRKDLTPLNESWSEESIHSRLSSIKERYKATTGQNLARTSHPIKEGVAVIQESTTMEQLKDFTNQCHEKFGITAFQIHIHRDEGHQGAEKWEPNLHAHILFDWTEANGKTIRTQRQNFAEMQTLLANSLGMERGKSSDKKHLTALQYKTEKEMERLLNALSQYEGVQEQLGIAKIELKKVDEQTRSNVKKAVSRVSEKLCDAMGLTVNDKEKNTLKEENEQLRENLKNLTKKFETVSSDNTRLNYLIKSKNSVIVNLQRENSALVLKNKNEIQSILNKLPIKEIQTLMRTYSFVKNIIEAQEAVCACE